jgi:hypothetical protein
MKPQRRPGSENRLLASLPDRNRRRFWPLAIKSN